MLFLKVIKFRGKDLNTLYLYYFKMTTDIKIAFGIIIIILLIVGTYAISKSDHEIIDLSRLSESNGTHYIPVNINELVNSNVKYIGKNVSINGELLKQNDNIGDLRLIAYDGYQYHIYGNCLDDEHRRYAFLNYRNPEQTGINPSRYTARGLVTEKGLLCAMYLE